MKRPAHQAHYVKMPVEPIKVIRGILSPEQLKGFYWGSAIKYLLRAPYKGQYDTDMEKMQVYVRWMKELEKKPCPSK